MASWQNPCRQQHRDVSTSGRGVCQAARRLIVHGCRTNHGISVHSSGSLELCVGGEPRLGLPLCELRVFKQSQLQGAACLNDEGPAYSLVGRVISCCPSPFLLQATRFRGAGTNVSFDSAGDCILPFSICSLNQNDAGSIFAKNSPHSKLCTNLRWRGTRHAARGCHVESSNRAQL